MAKAVFTHADGSIYDDRAERRRRPRAIPHPDARGPGSPATDAARRLPVAPSLAALRPHPRFLDFHRRQVFKG